MEYTTYKFYQSAFIDEAEYENLKTITTKNVKYVTNDLNLFISKEYNSGFIDSKIREKMYLLTSYIRNDIEFKSKLEKEEVYNLCNEIISKLNTIEITKEKKLDFFTNECKKRFSYEFENSYKIKLIFSTVEILELVAIDNTVIKILSEEKSPNVLRLCLSNRFLICINAIIEENSDILDDDCFFINLLYVMNTNLYVCENYFEFKLNKQDANLILKKTMYLMKKLEKIKNIDLEKGTSKIKTKNN